MPVKFGLVLAIILAAAGPVAALEDDARPSTAPSPPPDDGRRTIKRLPANLGRGVIGIFHRDNVLPVMAGATATGVASIWDDEVREALAGPDKDFGQFFETGGGAVITTSFVAGMFAAGRLARGPRFRAMTYDLLTASAVNAGYTGLLKVTVGRERPDHSDHRSFPSGHASSAFAIATVAERHYGWKVGAPAYTVAALVAGSRLQRDKHYLTDVVAGAALGYVVGRTVVRVNGRPLDPPANRTPIVWSVAPVVSGRAMGLQVSVAF